MTMALWLARAGRGDPTAPAVGHGTDVVATYLSLIHI